MKKALALFACTVTTILINGCTPAQLYSSAQSWQRNECAKIFDAQERSRCMADTSTTYEEYQAKTKTGGK